MNDNLKAAIIGLYRQGASINEIAGIFMLWDNEVEYYINDYFSS
jgi:hypothetical protein